MEVIATKNMLMRNNPPTVSPLGQKEIFPAVVDFLQHQNGTTAHILGTGALPGHAFAAARAARAAGARDLGDKGPRRGEGEGGEGGAVEVGGPRAGGQEGGRVGVGWGPGGGGGGGGKKGKLALGPPARCPFTVSFLVGRVFLLEETTTKKQKR